MIRAVLGYHLVKIFKNNLNFSLHIHTKFYWFLAILLPSYVLRTAVCKRDWFLKEKRY